jgi:hypothetical protein
LSNQAAINSLPLDGYQAASGDGASPPVVPIDYRPVKRVDFYAGVMISNVYGGLANGFQATQNIAPTPHKAKRSL